MALGGTAFALTLVLSILTIVFSSLVLAYTGGVNMRGSDEQKRFQPRLRHALIWFSSILLAVSVAVSIIVPLVQVRAMKAARSLPALVSGF